MKKIEDILARIRQHYGVKTNKEAMERWGIPKGTYDGWIRRKYIPDSRLRDFATREGISYSWLTEGEDPLPTLHSEEQIHQLYEMVRESVTPYGAHPLTKKLAKTFDALDDEDKQEVLDKLLPYIIERL